VMVYLEAHADPAKSEFKAKKFGITAKNTLGVYLKDLNALARKIKKDEALALQLFDTGVHEARILCSKIYPPKAVTKSLMNKWVKTFDNWESTDSFCMTCFAPSSWAKEMAFEWVQNEKEFIRRSGFVLMAAYGSSRKNEGNEIFRSFFQPMLEYAEDERNFVKKANSWALRTMGKRNVDLKMEAIAVAKKMQAMNSAAARWIANDALRELQSEKVSMRDYPRAIYRI